MPRKRIRSWRDTGDVLTGDGIQRVSAEQPLLTPDGGEGGSVLQTLGSKAEERVKRRKKKKDSYAQYLASSTWKKIRREILERDKNTCRACARQAQVVHHIRYPRNLGEEKYEWLYALCVFCHDEIHRRAAIKGCTLRRATREVLGLPIPAKQTKAQKRRGKPLPRKIQARRERRTVKAKRTALQQENNQLHETFKQNRERRERRWDLG